MPTASITINRTSGYAPMTVWVDGLNSGLDGEGAQDVLFEWQFGDIAQTNYSGNGNNDDYDPDNNIYKKMVPDWRLDLLGNEITNSVVRNQDLNTDQRCMVGAYTYHEAASGTISLVTRSRVGESPDSVGYTAIAAPGPQNSWAAVNGWQVLDISSYADIETAIAAVNFVGDRVILRLNSSVNYDIAATLTVTATNFWLVAKGNTEARIRRADAWSAAPTDPLLNIQGTISRVENIRFMGDSGGTPYDMTGLRIDANECTVMKCRFEDLGTCVVANNDYCYLNSNWFEECIQSAIEANGNYFVAHGNFSGNTESGNPQSQNGFLLDIGSNPGSDGVANCGLAFNRFRFLGKSTTKTPTANLGGGGTNDYPTITGVGSFTGPMRLMFAENVGIYRNVMHGGVNEMSTSTSNIRFDANVITSGGLRSALEINNGTSDVMFCNNLFRMGNATDTDYTAGILNGHNNDSIDGSVSNIWFINNTTYLRENIRIGIGGVFQLESNGRTLSNNAFRFYNNVFAADSNFLSYLFSWTSVESAVVFNSNTLPDRLPQSPIAKIDNVKTNMSLFTSAYDFDAEQDLFSFSSIDNRMFDYYLDRTKYPSTVGCNLDIPGSRRCLRDFHGNLRNFASPANVQKGAIETPDNPFPEGSTAAFDVTWNPVVRSRGGGQSDCDDGYFEIRDPTNSDKLIYGLNGQSVTSLFGATGTGAIGDYVRTDIVATPLDDGIDIQITYTNDGPGGQDNVSAEVVEQRLGTLSTNMFTLGRVASVNRNRGVSKWFEFENYDGNRFNLATTTYPGGKSNPLTAIRNREYVCGINYIWDYTEVEGLNFQETASSSTSNNRSWNMSINWYEPKLGDQTWFSLREGQSFVLTLSIRVGRQPNRDSWITVMKPYRDWFWNKFGPRRVEYQKDPRPIAGIVPAGGESAGPTNNFGYRSRNPAQNGWNQWADYFKNELYPINRYQRFLMWAPSGRFDYGNLNFPFIMWSRFYNGSRRVENGIYVGDRDYTEEAFVPEFVTEIPLMEDLPFEFPQVGYYWGRATDPMEGPDWDTITVRVIDYPDPADLALFDEELGYMAGNMRCQHVGMDAYNFKTESTNDDWTQEEIDLIDYMKEQYPHARLSVELSLPDYIHRKVGNYYRFDANDGIVDGFNDYADYIIPGHESFGALRYDQYRNPLDSFTFQTDDGFSKKSIMDCARYGLVPLPLGVGDDETLDDYESFGHAADTWYRYYSRPADNGAPAVPQNFRYRASRNQAQFSARYNILRWDANTEADFSHYEIWRAKVTDGIPDTEEYLWVELVNRPVFYDRVFRVGQTNYYRIRAVDQYGNKSGFTDPIMVTRISDDPARPRPRPLAARVISSNNTVRVDWSVD